MHKTLPLLLTVAVLLSSSHLWAHDRKFVTPVPKTIAAEFSIKHLDQGGEAHQVLFEGFKGSVGVESGKVTMNGGQKGEKHSNEIYEEVLIILEGRGTIEVEGKEFTIKKGDAVYIPPYHVHQMMCDSGSNLEYVYVAAPTFIPLNIELQPSKLKKKNTEKKAE